MWYIKPGKEKKIMEGGYKSKQDSKGANATHKALGTLAARCLSPPKKPYPQ